MVNESQRPLPAFENPPVIETLLGVQFSPIEALSVLHFGIFWNEVRDAYPNHQIKPPLDPAVEDFEPTRAIGLAFGLRVVSEPPLRCWLIDATSTELLQLQKDRFVRNWRKQKPDHVYPRYEFLKPKFRQDWERFCEFLRGNGIAAPEVNQCEITYVNHIEAGPSVNIDKVVRFLAPKPSRDFLPDPEMVQLSASFMLPGKSGRLHIVLQPVIAVPEAKEALQLTLTARGRPASSSLTDILHWFDMGHEWIVRGFTDFTSQEMHRAWRRIP